jgi:hypothetical protein
MRRALIAAAMLGFVVAPVYAQPNGKSDSPGPGQKQNNPQAKDFAPGQQQKNPGDAKNFASGQKQNSPQLLLGATVIRDGLARR